MRHVFAPVSHLIILGYNNLAAPGIFESRIFFHHSNDSSLFFRSLFFFSLLFFLFFFFLSSMRDIEIIGPQKWSKLFAGRMERKIDVEAESVIRVREKEREGEFITQRVTDNFYFSRVVGIDTTFPSRAVFFPDQHWRASASPWFFIGGVIRLEPRPTRIPIPSFFSAFSFATPYYCSPSSPPV